MEKNLSSNPPEPVSSQPPCVEPPAAEKEVPGYTDDFTLSGGCCSGDSIPS